MTEAEPRATYAQVLREPRFRLLFFSRSLAITADVLRTVALSVLVLAETGSAFLTALTWGIAFLPQAFGGTLLGSLADHIRPRRLIAAGYGAECVVAVVLALGHLPVAADLALVAAIACFTPVFQGASARLVAGVLTGDAYVLGRGLSSIASSGSQLLGLAAAGAAVTTLGAHHALLICAGAHALASAAIRLRLPDFPALGARAGSVVGTSLRTTRRLLRPGPVRTLLLAAWLPPLCFAGAEALLIPYASQVGIPHRELAFLLAAPPAGMLLADYAVGRWAEPRTRERLVPVLLVLLGAPLIGFASKPDLVPSMLLLAAGSAGFSYSLGIQRSFVEQLEPATQGQAFALLSTGLMTFQGVGPLLSGLVAGLTSPAVAMAGSGVAAIGVAAALLRPVRHVLQPRRTGPPAVPGEQEVVHPPFKITGR